MDCARNIVTANFSGGGTSATTAALWQWDYGQALCITGIEDLPAAFEVHFSTNRTGGVSTTAVGADGQVTIPNVLLTIGKNLNAWIYLSDAQGEGETEYSVTIPVKARPMPEYYDVEATGEFDDVVRQVSEYAETAQTAADNAGASATAAAGSATAAAASEAAAEEDASRAEYAMREAVAAHTAATTQATIATEKASQASAYATAAGQSATSAEQSKTAAIGAATSAGRSAQTAAQSATAATTASANAAASATDASASATAAAANATAASRSASTASTAAQTATEKAAEASASATAAETAKDAAQTAQAAAEAAETTAVESATTATAKAAEAVQSASGAAQSKTDAEAAAARAEQAAATLMVDTALSDTSTNPVQNKVITGELTDVKSALNSMASGIYATEDYKAKYAINQSIALDVGIGNTVSTVPTPSTNYASIIIPCKIGDVFTLTGKGGATPRLWGFADTDYKLLSVAAGNLSATDLVKTADRDGYFISNVEYRNAIGYELSVWHELVTTDYIEYYNALTVTPGADSTISGVTVAYIGENKLGVYGTPSNNGFFSRFNGNLVQSNSASGIPVKIMPAGTYTLYWDNSRINFAYTTSSYANGVNISSGTPFTAESEFAIYIATKVLDGNYGTSDNPTMCAFTLFRDAVSAGVLDTLHSTIDVYARAMADAKTGKGFYSLNTTIKNSNAGYISIGAVGDTVDYTPISSSSWLFGIFPVKKGDVFAVSGSGGNNSRLWCFVNENDVILSRASTNLSVDDMILVAPQDGKLIINTSFSHYDVRKQISDGGVAYAQAVDASEYKQKNDGLDILSAFSNVTCCGDSLTASVVYTADNGDGTYQTRSAYKKYPWILGHKIGAEAESVATGGFSATDWWRTYSDRIVEKENHLVIIYLGTNGGLTDTLDTDAPGSDYTQYANTNTGNYCKMVAKALDVGARVLLVKIHQGGGGNVFLTNDVIDKIAEKFDVAVVDVPFLFGRKYHAFPDNTGTNTLHYNDLGYAAFADALIKNVGYLPDGMAVRLIPN